MLSVIDGGSGLTAEEQAALSVAATGLVTHEVAEVMRVRPDLVREWLLGGGH